MKNLLSILIATFFLSNIVTYAQKKNNPFTEIALIQAKRKNPTSKGDTPISQFGHIQIGYEDNINYELKKKEEESEALDDI